MALAMEMEVGTFVIIAVVVVLYQLCVPVEVVDMSKAKELLDQLLGSNCEGLDSDKENSEKIAAYLRSKLGSEYTGSQGRMTIDGWEVFFKKPHDGETDVLSVSVKDGIYWLDFEVFHVKEVDSPNKPSSQRSLFDPKHVSVKKKKLKRDFDQEKDVIKAIDKFLNK